MVRVGDSSVIQVLDGIHHNGDTVAFLYDAGAVHINERGRIIGLSDDRVHLKLHDGREVDTHVMYVKPIPAHWTHACTHGYGFVPRLLKALNWYDCRSYGPGSVLDRSAT